MPFHETLYAKSLSGEKARRSELLVGHSHDVNALAMTILRHDDYAILRAMHLEHLAPVADQIMWIASWMHDLGKMSSAWIRMRKGGAPRQLLRHEVISAHVFSQLPWFEQLGGDVYAAILSVILSHHRKFGREKEEQQSEDEDVLTFDANWTEARKLIVNAASQCNLPVPDVLPSGRVTSKCQVDFEDQEVDSFLRKLTRCKNVPLLIRSETREPVFISMLKCILVCADSSASAFGDRHFSRPGVPKGKRGRSVSEMKDTITNMLNACPSVKYLNTMRKVRGGTSVNTKAFKDYEFQTKVANSTSRTVLLLAGTGQGKTNAAYMWGAEWVQREKRSFVFTLPTTATTSEHFDNYGGKHTSLVHSRSQCDLALKLSKIKSDTTLSASDKQYHIDSLREQIDRIDAVQTMLPGKGKGKSGHMVCTVDSVLWSMGYSHRGMIYLPKMSLSAIVFDEVQAYDDLLFEAFIAFLITFPEVPVLIMTATLPPHRRRLIEEARPDVEEPAKGDARLSESETRNRYVLHKPASISITDPATVDRIQKANKLLIVRNQVNWAMESYIQLMHTLGWDDIYICHSRYRHMDRGAIQQRAISAFKEKGRRVALVSTQVVEMSFDLSADLLITDLTIVWSLVQRLGRLNRRGEHPFCDALIDTSNTDTKYGKLPYTKSELEETETLIEHLCGRPISQYDLAQAMNQVIREDIDWWHIDRDVPFRRGEYNILYTKPLRMREDSYTIDCILQTDLDNCPESSLASQKLASGGRKPNKIWLEDHKIRMNFPSTARAISTQWEWMGPSLIVPDGYIDYDFNPDTCKGIGAKWTFDSP